MLERADTGRRHTQNHAKTGGILSIVAGAFGVLSLTGCICAAAVMMLMPGGFGHDFYYNATMPEGFFAIMAAMYIIMGIFSALVGALAIVGGVFALKKKYWGWALAGSIGATMAFFPCGIPAIIFIAMSRPEFQNAAPPVAPAPMEKIVG
jgi:hypothetical protein